jgi:hypothetical protein
MDAPAMDETAMDEPAMDEPGGTGVRALQAIGTAELEPLFWPPARLAIDSTWTLHVPFAHWLVAVHRPRAIVEVGTRTGVAYAAFCEAVQRTRLDCRCLAIGTRRTGTRSDPGSDRPSGPDGRGAVDDGDDDDDALQRFHDERYGSFSELLRAGPDGALVLAPAGSIDLLHIDGLHEYEAACGIFEQWRTKLSERAIVLFHNTRGAAGIGRLWAELSAQHAAFEFLHGQGLGVLAVGALCGDPVQALARLSTTAAAAVLRERFALLGERWHADMRAAMARAEHAAKVERLQADLGAARAGQRAIATVEAEAARRAADERRMRADAASRTAGARREAIEATALVSRVRQEMFGAYQRGQRELAEVRRQAQQDLAGVHEQARLALEDARARTELALAEADTRLADAREQARRIAKERDAILNSTAWRATGPLRAVARRLPAPALRRAKQAARLVWWTVTLRLRSRLAERRATLRHVQQVAASPEFDAAWYVARYPDVAASGLDPALHYATIGAGEGRQPGPQADSLAR